MKGMGTSKHRKSGKTTKSPRTRLLMKLEAQRTSKKKRKQLMYDKVSQLMDEER